MTVEKRLSFNIIIIVYFVVSEITIFRQLDVALRVEGNLQHKQMWRGVNVTQSTETRSSYLKQGLLRSHGRGLGMKSLVRNRKPSTAKYAAGRSRRQAQTPLTSLTTCVRIM